MIPKVDICNLALSNLGVSQFITNLETEKSLEAIVCRKWYEPAMRFVQRDFDWNFNRRRMNLAVFTGTVPDPWQYMYIYPSDCEMIRAICPYGVRTPRIDQRIPYEVAVEADPDGKDIKVIYTDQDAAVVRYSKYITDTSLFDSQFVVAASYLLSTFIAAPLAVKFDIVDRARNAYVGMKAVAGASNNNEAEEGPEPETESIAFRNT